MNESIRIRISTAVAALLVPQLASLVAAQDAAFRDPFWPVGYAPAAEKSTSAPVVKPAQKLPFIKPVVVPPRPVVDWKEARRNLKVTGFAEGGGVRRCFVNGRLVSEGETVSLDHKEMRYSWRVVRIEPNPLKNHFEEIDARPVADGELNVKP